MVRGMKKAEKKLRKENIMTPKDFFDFVTIAGNNNIEMKALFTMGKKNGFEC